LNMRVWTVIEYVIYHCRWINVMQWMKYLCWSLNTTILRGHKLNMEKTRQDESR